MRSGSLIKATSFLCLLGFGIGFGSVLLYKLYNRITSRWWTPADQPPTSSLSTKKVRRRSNGKRQYQKPSKSSDDDDTADDDSSDEEDLEAQDTMGNSLSDNAKLAVYYERHRNNIHFGNYSRQNNATAGSFETSQEFNIPNPRPNIRNRHGFHGHQLSHDRSREEHYPNSHEPPDEDISPTSASSTYMELMTNKYGRPRSTDLTDIDNTFYPDEFADNVSRDFSMIGNFSPGSLHEKNMCYDLDKLEQNGAGDANFSLKQPPEDVLRRSHAPSSGSVRVQSGNFVEEDYQTYLRQRPRAGTSPQTADLSSDSTSPIFTRRYRRGSEELGNPCQRNSTYTDCTGVETTDSDVFEREYSPSAVNQFEKIEQELTLLKGEILNMDDQIQILSKTPDYESVEACECGNYSEADDLDKAFHILRRHKRSNSLRSSRASSFSGDLRPSPQRVLSTSEIVSQVQQQLVSDKFHVHVHVHVHDDKKPSEPVNRRLMTKEFVEAHALPQSPDDTSSSSLAESMPSQGSSHEPSPTLERGPDTGFPVQPSDFTNNNDSVSGNSLSVPTNSIKVNTHVNIGEVHDIKTYADQEWRGNTRTAKTIVKGYNMIPDKIHCSRLRRIRGDNYCAIRASLFQIFVKNVGLFKHTGSLNNILETLEERFYGKHAYLRQWNFANRLQHTPKDVFDTMTNCLTTLHNLFVEVSNVTDCKVREARFVQISNGDQVTDIRMMEGVKLLMMLHAIDLHEEMIAENEVPVFVWLMYARDTSDCPKTLFKNHINTVGDSGGLEQVEMFLLGHTLGVIVESVRPSQYGSEDFVSCFPSDIEGKLPRIPLVAEDDRHYNVLLP